MTLPLRLTLTLIVTGLSWLYGGGWPGLVTLALYAIGVLPGVLLGAALFGARAAGWTAGAVMGYGLLAIGFWIPIAIGRPGLESFVFVWLMLLLLCNAARSACKGPLITLPAWTKRDSAAWLLLLHLTPLLVGSPFGRTGEQDASGTRSYRAYFTADFVWHMALTNEVARFEPSLRNPYQASEPLQYYWTYFLPAAAIATRGEAGATTHVESTLKIAAMMTSLAILSMIYLVAWAATGRRWAAMTATAIVVLASSFEGVYALNQLRHSGAPLDSLRDLNIDAVTRWSATIQGLRVDGIPRAMWWTPQHAASSVLGLIAVLALARETAARWPAFLLIGLALGLSITFNPLLGAVFSAIYGGTVLWDVASRKLTLRAALPAAIAAIPVALALWWCVAAGMGAGASALSFGLHEYARRAPFTALFLSLGGVLIPAVIGMLPSRHFPFRPAVPAFIALVLGLLLMHYVTITDSSWVGFRAGNIILVTISMLVARGLIVAYQRSGRFLAMTFATLVMVAGLPTTAIDWYNARDMENRRMGPSFPWVIALAPDQQAGYDWVRRATSPDAIVQFDPVARDRANWSGIPSFTGRRMAAGLPISLLPDARRDELAARVHRLFTELTPEAAHAEAVSLGIGYLWIDRDDRTAPAGPSLERLSARPDLFLPVFRQDATVVYAIAR